MSYLSNALVACETLQGRLEDFWQVTDANGADENMPLAEFLASPTNRRKHNPLKDNLQNEWLYSYRI